MSDSTVVWASELKLAKTLFHLSVGADIMGSTWTAGAGIDAVPSVVELDRGALRSIPAFFSRPRPVPSPLPFRVHQNGGRN